MSPKRSKETTVSRAARTRAPEARAPAPLAGWVAPLVYALVCIVLFREFVIGPDRILGNDTLALSYFARNFYTEFLQRFQTFPLWNPLLFGGIPFVDGMHGDIFYPPSLALFFMDAAQMWGWKMVLHVFLAGIFTYLWLRELGLRREFALFGGLVYMMGADLVSLVLPGGDGKLFVSTLAPLAFLLAERAVARRRVQDYALLSLGLALVVLTSHMQLAYFAIWGVTLYFLFRLFQWWRAEHRVAPVLTHFAAFGLAGLLSVAAAAVQFFPPLGYLRTYSHRAEKTVTASDSLAYTFATTYSLHPEEIVALAVPEFVGDNAGTELIAGDRYWGRNPFKINHEYAGFIPLFLLPLLFLKQRRARTWFFAGLGTLALLYALGANTPFFRLFYLIPGVSLFRAPSIIIFLYGLSLATLGAFALERAVAWSEGGAEQGSARKYLWIAVGVTALLALLANTDVLLQLWRAVLYRNMDASKAAALSANTPYIGRGFGITFLLALAVAGVWEGLARRFYGPRTTIVLLCALAFLDLYRVDRRFIRSTALMNDPNDALFFVDDATRFLQERQRAEVFRVLDIGALLDRSHANTLGVHGLEQVVGHHGNEIGRYRELVGGDKMANLGNSEFRLLDVTNTKYVTSPGPLNMPGLTEVYRDSRTIVYHRPAALPRAYLVGRTEVVPDSLAVARLLGPGFDYRTTGILGEPLPAGVNVQPDPQGTVQWVQRGANAFALRVRTDRPALLMVLDNYYPQWRATVDGQAVPTVRANYTFRAVPVPAGEHQVAFRYAADNLRTPAIVSVVTLIALGLAAFGLPLVRRLRPGITAPAA